MLSGSPLQAPAFTPWSRAENGCRRPTQPQALPRQFLHRRPVTSSREFEIFTGRTPPTPQPNASCFNDFLNVAGKCGNTSPPYTPSHGLVRDWWGAIATLDVPGSVATQVEGMNVQGAVAGSYQDSRGVSHGFARSPQGSTARDGRMETSIRFAAVETASPARRRQHALLERCPTAGWTSARSNPSWLM